MQKLVHPILLSSLATVLFASFQAQNLCADGKVVPPRNYKGSLEEKSQEAVIIFHGSDEPGEATEELILKIEVEGNASEFAWVVPFPNEPKIEKENAKIFKELFDYVEARRYQRRKRTPGNSKSAAKDEEAPSMDVKVLSRKVVGEFDVAVVQESKAGGLNPWLEREGFQTLDDADDVLKFYRDKEYVFACIKVKSEALKQHRKIESHPLRFSFKTGGRDGVYFPMKMTGLQSRPFDVNLYIFYRYWINDDLNQFGYRHRGFELVYRDWDTSQCVPNGGKQYSLPSADAFLKNFESRLKNVVSMFQKLHPGEKYYLTNIRARGLDPGTVRDWSDDLWMFPYYTNERMIPYDVLDDGVASAAWPSVQEMPMLPATRTLTSRNSKFGLAIIALGFLTCVILGTFLINRIFRKSNRGKWESFENVSEPYGDDIPPEKI